jgi:hypothetical protein
LCLCFSPQLQLWSGLVNGYYGQRWALYISFLSSALQSGSPVDEAGYARQLYAFETAFPGTNLSFAVLPQGDAVSLSQRLRAKYSNLSWPRFDRRSAAATRVPRRVRRH